MTVEQYMKLWGEGCKHREKYSPEWGRSEAKYDGKLFYESAQWQSRVSSPMVYEDVEKMVAKELRVIYSKRLFSIEPVQSSDWASVAKHDKLIEYQDFRVPRRREKLETLSRYKFLYGNKIGKIFWDEVLCQPNYKPINPWRFVGEPYVDGLEDCGWVMEEMLVNTDTIKSLADNNKWDMSGYDDAMASPAKFEQKSRDDDASEKTHIIEYYSADGKYAVILNKRYLAFEGDSPYDIGTFPYFGCPCTTRCETMWGNGLDTCVIDVADADDRMLNQQLDLPRLLMNPPRMVGARAGIESGHIDVSIGNNIMCENINEIAEMKFNGAREATTSAREALNAIKIAKNGLDPYATGQSVASNNDTAGGTAVMAEKADERLSLYLDKEEDMLVRLGMIWVKLNEQFAMKDGEVKTLKVKTNNVIREETMVKSDIYSGVDIVVEPPSKTINKAATAQVMTQAMGTLKGLPNVNQDLFVEEYIKSLDIPSPDRFILSKDEQIKQATEQAQFEAEKSSALSSAAPAAPISAPGQMSQPTQMTDQNATSNTAAMPGVTNG